MQLQADTPGSQVRVLREVTAAGLIACAASQSHRIKVHAGDAVSGLCRAQAFTYTRGDVDLIPAGESDSWQQHQESTAITIELSPALLKRAAEDIGVDPARVSLAPLHQVRDTRIEHIVWALEAERADGYPTGRLFGETLALGLAVHLLGQFRVRELKGGMSRAQLKRVTAYIEEHLDRDLSLARLADVAELSVSHFKTLFRRSKGVPVHAYVIERRVERARRLLLRGQLSAAQVALDAGFAHQSHMARCMKRVLGVTPSALR